MALSLPEINFSLSHSVVILSSSHRSHYPAEPFTFSWGGAPPTVVALPLPPPPKPCPSLGSCPETLHFLALYTPGCQLFGGGKHALVIIALLETGSIYDTGWASVNGSWSDLELELQFSYSLQILIHWNDFMLFGLQGGQGGEEGGRVPLEKQL